ncbi:MAG: excinuclease ABC subunit UvrC [Alphaproteobacteria bacterium]|nr:MAG: excinuclease ABC subunit UvrC [Alphaproteobacteria bacterium]
MSSNGKTSHKTRLAAGTEAILSFQRHAGKGPGVYRMLNTRGEVLYVGKARNLHARVAAYTRPAQLPHRLQRMIAETVKMEFTTTQSEAEALLLEAVLIKEHLPRYNILLRDDKSFPFIYISGNHEFPRIAKHRGAKQDKGDYFGPFMSSGGAVDQTIATLQRAFLIRNCSDSFFAARTRPCLQYHIKRCSAPCVNYVTAEEYNANIKQAKDFLRGKHTEIQQKFAANMNEASRRQDYEVAAQYRDRIRALTIIQAKQRVHIDGIGDVDVIAAAQKSGKICVQVFTYRDDCYLGNHAFFPKAGEDEDLPRVLSAFIAQFYASRPAPKEILLSESAQEQNLLAQALSLKSGHKVSISAANRGKRRQAVLHAVKNAENALDRALAERTAQEESLRLLAEKLDLPKIPQRIEVYDNSHIQGKNAIGAMIVATPEGFQKKSYRKFNIRIDELEKMPDHGGDDYAMLRQVLRRRFARMNKDDGDTSSAKPDLLLIDGGLGQLNTALQSLSDSGIIDIPILGIAKGPDRNAGRERFFMEGRPDFQMPVNDPVLHFLQRLRDEAHRFAIGGHRKKRISEMGRSELDAVPGIGASRKRALLNHFGSVASIRKASLLDLEMVKGINKHTAKRLYNYFHSDSD